MTQLAEQLREKVLGLKGGTTAPPMTANRSIGMRAPCQTPIYRNTYCLTRGGDVVFHADFKRTKNGNINGFSEAINLRTGDIYHVWVGFNANGKAHFARGFEHLDVVYTFPQNLYPGLYRDYVGKDVTGPNLYRYLQKAIADGLNGVEMKRLSVPMEILRAAHFNGTGNNFKPAVRPRDKYSNGVARPAQPRYDEPKPKQAKPAPAVIEKTPEPKKEIAMGKPKQDLMVSYTPTIRHLKNEVLTQGFRISIAPGKKGTVHLNLGSGVQEGWTERVAALTVDDLTKLIESLDAVHQVLKGQ